MVRWEWKERTRVIGLGGFGIVFIVLSCLHVQGIGLRLLMSGIISVCVSGVCVVSEQTSEHGVFIYSR